MNRRILTIFIMLAFLGVLAAPIAYLQAKRKSPNFNFADVKGQKHSLTTVKGKVTLVDMWATWCGPCRKEIPSLIQLQKKHGDKLTILGVSYDEDKEALDNFLK